ncbi:unnamed protein product, partial [Meganyctiphanes norvegica]
MCKRLSIRAYVRINKHKGETFTMTAGVPQGDVLSPTLFLIVGNDYPEPTRNNSQKNFAMQYADDFTQIIISKFNTTINQASRDQHKINVEDEIMKQNDFERRWKIKTNVNKFTIINIGFFIAPTIVINNTPIPYVTHTKLLGLQLTRNNFYVKQIQQNTNQSKSRIKKTTALQITKTKAEATYKQCKAANPRAHKSVISTSKIQLPGASEFLLFVKRSGLSSDWSSRPRLSHLAEHHFFRHDFLKINENLTNILLLTEDTRDQFIKSLPDCLRKYPEDLVSSTMAAALLSRPLLLQPATVTHLMPAVLTPKSGNSEENNLDGLFCPAVFERDIVPPLVELYSVHDATVRQVLLSHLQSYVNLIPKDRLKLEVEHLLGLDCTQVAFHPPLVAALTLPLILSISYINYTYLGVDKKRFMYITKTKPVPSVLEFSLARAIARQAVTGNLPLSQNCNRLSNSLVKQSVRIKCLEDLGERKYGPPVLSPRKVPLKFDTRISSELSILENISLEGIPCVQIPERSSPDGGEDRSSNGCPNSQNIQTFEEEGSGQWADWEDTKGGIQMDNFSDALVTLNQLATNTTDEEETIDNNTGNHPVQADRPNQSGSANTLISTQVSYNKKDKSLSNIGSAMKVVGNNYKNKLIKRQQNFISHNKSQELGKEYDIMAIKINKKKDEELDFFADLVPSFSTKKYDLESLLIEANKSQNPISPSVSATLAGMDLDTRDEVGDAWGDEEDFFSHNSLVIKSLSEKVNSCSLDMGDNQLLSDYESWTNLEESQNKRKECNSIVSIETITDTDNAVKSDTAVTDKLFTSVCEPKLEDAGWEDDWGNDF